MTRCTEKEDATAGESPEHDLLLEVATKMFRFSRRVHKVTAFSTLFARRCQSLASSLLNDNDNDMAVI